MTLYILFFRVWPALVDVEMDFLVCVETSNLGQTLMMMQYGPCALCVWIIEYLYSDWYKRKPMPFQNANCLSSQE